MPRVLFLANASSIHTIRWANAIANQGFETHVLSLHPIQAPRGARISLYQAPVPPNWGYFANRAWVRRLIVRIKPDLVHAHYASGYGTVAALVDFHPTIVSVWGTDVYEFPRQSFLHRSLLRFNLARADKVLSTSHVMARETHKYTSKPIEVTPFGVDLEQFKPQPVETIFDASDIVIGTVKALEATYGIEYLIQAFRLLKDKHPGLPLKLLIVGGGSQESYLKRLTQELSVAESTVFTGPVDHALVAKYHNMLTIFVSVSDSESFGVAVIEASACEKPVVVSNVGGLPEVVEAEVSGFIVQPRNPRQTADAIEKLILDESLRVKMGKAGRERVQRLYNWEDNVRQMSDIYSAMLQISGPSRLSNLDT